MPVAGGRLHVVDLAPARPSDAPPIVLLHGASGNLEDQRLTLGTALAARHRVILVDRPGHGFSDRPGGQADASPGRQAALIAQALARLGVARAIVVGHSWSGALAAALALDFPERVAGLVLLAPVTHPWPGGISWYNRLASTPVIGRLFAETCAFPLGSLLIARGVENVFEPQLPPADYVRRTATRLVLRPQEFIANAQDVAALKAFVTAQAPRYGADRGADRDHQRRSRHDGAAGDPFARRRDADPRREADRAARHRPHAASRGGGRDRCGDRSVGEWRVRSSE